MSTSRLLNTTPTRLSGLVESKWFFLAISAIFAGYLIAGTAFSLGFEAPLSSWDRFWVMLQSLIMFAAIWGLGYACAAPDRSGEAPVLWKISTGAGHYYTDSPIQAQAFSDRVVAEYRQVPAEPLEQ
jgi:hypothetical protein